MAKNIIEFRKLPIPESYGPPLKKIYYVVENGRSKVIDNFKALTQDQKDLIKDLICRIATNEDFKSPKIKYNLKGYNYGEIRPKPHRFFFFQKHGDNIIFFEYVLKKRGSFKDEFYERINKEKERYEKAFENFIQGI